MNVQKDCNVKLKNWCYKIFSHKPFHFPFLFTHEEPVLVAREMYKGGILALTIS